MLYAHNRLVHSRLAPRVRGLPRWISRFCCMGSFSVTACLCCYLSLNNIAAHALCCCRRRALRSALSPITCLFFLCAFSRRCLLPFLPRLSSCLATCIACAAHSDRRRRSHNPRRASALAVDKHCCRSRAATHLLCFLSARYLPPRSRSHLPPLTISPPLLHRYLLTRALFTPLLPSLSHLRCLPACVTECSIRLPAAHRTPPQYALHLHLPATHATLRPTAHTAPHYAHTTHTPTPTTATYDHFRTHLFALHHHTHHLRLLFSLFTRFSYRQHGYALITFMGGVGRLERTSLCDIRNRMVNDGG